MSSGPSTNFWESATPSDMSYGTPTVVDPQSPYVQQTVSPSPGPAFASPGNQVPFESAWNASELQNQAFFLVSPDYHPATPAPVGWYGTGTPLASASFQTPPGLLQSPEPLWNTEPMEDIVQASENGTVMDDIDDSDGCEIKYERLIELVRKTEKIEGSDYMEMMFEVNSLIYDLIALDQARSQVSIKDASAPISECYVCRALKVIGTGDMDAKVESERILLEAIAVSEACFGEEHSGASHFRVKLFLLYEDWDCRVDSTCGVLLRIMVFASRKVPTRKLSDLVLDLLGLPEATAQSRCAWIQAPTQEPFSDSSSRQLSALSIRDDTAHDSPRMVWEIISAILERLVFIWGDEVNGFEPFLDLILPLGPESADGPSYFWMATFIAVFYEMWGAIYTSKLLIGNAASKNLPDTNAIQSTLEQLRQNPYRLEQSLAVSVNAEPSPKGATSSSLMKDQADDSTSKVTKSLGELKELRLTLAEFSLTKLEKSDHQDTFLRIFNGSASQMQSLLCDAASHGYSTLITELEEHFGDERFDGEASFTDLLNLCGVVSKWADESPLHLAISSGNCLSVEALLNAGADPDGPGGWGEIPVNLAADSCHDDIVRLLIKRGADIGRDPSAFLLRFMIDSLDQELHAKFLAAVSDSMRFLSLLCAISIIGESERYEFLDRVSERIREKLKLTEEKTLGSGEPLLHSILYRHDRDYLREFLDEEDHHWRGIELILNVLAGAHIEQQARGILESALFGTDKEMEDVLRPTKPSELPALHYLVSRNAPSALGVFLDLKPNLAALDTKGNTALHIAAEQNRVACAKLLLPKFGIYIELENNDGETALQIADKKGHKEIAEEILPMSERDRGVSQDSSSDEEDGWR